MSESTVNPTPPTAPATPAWAADVEPDDDGRFNFGQWHAWGKTKLRLERYDEGGKVGQLEVEVRFGNQVVDIPILIAGELSVLLDRVLEEVPLAEVMRDVRAYADTTESEAIDTSGSRDPDASDVVDARFAGGPILVDQDEYLDQNVVKFGIPGANDVPLFPHEARALAEALSRHADAIDAPRGTLRRPIGTDDALRELDNE
jgi:hypothetical protein